MLLCRYPIHTDSRIETCSEKAKECLLQHPLNFVLSLRCYIASLFYRFDCMTKAKL